ncbi:MAG: hypothetical protein KF833_22405 [Verrucomicrobiae bacterium]|nr:hypothetical protein [Verrucomicrobiae bacterium]
MASHATHPFPRCQRPALLAALLTGFPIAGLSSPPEPPRLTVQRDQVNVVISWTGTGTLESAPTVTGPWEPVATAANPHRMEQPVGTAWFRIRQSHLVTLLRAGTGSGTVRSTPAGLDCGATCEQVFAAGTTLTLRAEPDAGSSFEGWSGDCSGTGDCDIALDQPRTVTATFTSAPTAGGFVNGDFEQGPNVGWEQYPGPVIFHASVLGQAQPHSGQYAAWLGMDGDGRRIAQLGQRITLPNRQPLYLNFAAWVYSEEICDVPWYDRLTLYVNDQPVIRNERVCRGGGTDGWQRFSLDLSPLAGQSASFVFEMSSVDALASVLLLDDITVADAPWAALP